MNANGIDLYSVPPDPFIILGRLGYTQSTKAGVINTGLNNLSLNFCPTFGVSTIVSSGFITYFIKSFVNYGDTKEKAQGGMRNVTFEDGTNKTFIIGNASDDWDNRTDAIDDAVDRLLSQFTNKDGKVQIVLNQENLELSSLDISGVPSLWETEVQVRRWH